MTATLKTDSQRRLARIAGQVDGIRRMVESDRTCGDIMQQIVAVRAALDNLGVSFLSEHLQTCVLHQGAEDDEGCCGDLPAERRNEEIKATLKRFLQ
jgi:DNA-binding FrmR family transcriptional regulator